MCHPGKPCLQGPKRAHPLQVKWRALCALQLNYGAIRGDRYSEAISESTIHSLLHEAIEHKETFSLSLSLLHFRFLATKECPQTTYETRLNAVGNTHTTFAYQQVFLNAKPCNLNTPRINNCAPIPHPTTQSLKRMAASPYATGLAHFPDVPETLWCAC
jgi:hypothetical protein